LSGDDFLKSLQRTVLLMTEIESLVEELAAVSAEKNRIVEQDAEIRSRMVELMQKQRIRSVEGAGISVCYVEGATRTGVDTERLKAEYPDVAVRCVKQTLIKPFLKVKVKD
jgi:predicted phage-related endonuclease